MKKHYQLQHTLEQWLNSPSGKNLLLAEQASLDKVTIPASRELLLTIGPDAFRQLADSFEFRSEVNVGILHEFSTYSSNKNAVIAEFSELPLPPNSVDMALLPHTLEFSKKPNHVLRAAHSTLRPDGFLILIHFNPISWFGIKKQLVLSNKAPWCARLQTTWKIHSWLELLNYQIIKTTYHYEQIKQTSHLPFYMIIAQKKVFGLTPVKPVWQSITDKVFKPQLGTAVGSWKKT